MWINGCYNKAVTYFVQDFAKNPANRPTSRRAAVGVSADRCD